MMQRPDPGEHHEAFAGYVSLVPESDVMSLMESQAAELSRHARSVPAERESFAYAPGKWSIREVVGHVIDAERVFGYRAFCIARGERQPLPGFEENDYAAISDAGTRELAALATEFAAVREANLACFRRLDDVAWQRVGNANGNPISVRALVFVMAGHLRHHLGVLRSRYAVGAGA
jgi:hypothetical protein